MLKYVGKCAELGDNAFGRKIPDPQESNSNGANSSVPGAGKALPEVHTQWTRKSCLYCLFSNCPVSA